MTSERDPLLGPANQVEAYNDDHDGAPMVQQNAPVQTQVYAKRWYILLLFGMLGFSQGHAWGTWGPIADSAEFAFDWSNSTIALLALWGPITFMITVMISSWILETWGIRCICLIGAGFVVLGTGLRCITTQQPAVTWLVNAAQICVSVTGPIAMSSVTAVSATWFPPTQRTTATAIANRCMSFAGLNSILGPYLVREVNSEMMNTTSVHNSSAQIREEIRHDIWIYMLIQFGIAGVVMVAMLIHFPAKPPTPPSFTASQSKAAFIPAVKQLLVCKEFWILGVPYSVAYGVQIGWGTLLDVNLKDNHLSQVQVGWVSFSGTLAGIPVGILIGRLADVVHGRTKPIMFVLYALCTTAGTYFALNQASYITFIPFSLVGLIIARVVCAITMAGIVPIVFETVCEAAYPVPESVTVGLLTLMKNFWLLVFLVIQIGLNTTTNWLNWGMVGATGICVPLLFLFKQDTKRLKVDLAHENTQRQNQSVQNGLDDADASTNQVAS